MGYKKICFVIMGFGKKTDYSTGQTMDLDKTYKNIIKPIVEEKGFSCIRADEIKESGLIDRSMYGLLLYADLVIADISTYNPNAIYELGVRHALKPFHTIIIKESRGNIPFDLDHTRIMNYSHLGEDIGFEETNRCKEELGNLIDGVVESKNIDSPVYSYLDSIQAPKISKEDVRMLIGELADEYDTLFAVIEKANMLRRNGKFNEAALCWKNASEKIPSETYFIQQLAFCTYKSKIPSEILALTEAARIINPLIENCTVNDPESLGIAGAIYKNMYLISKDSETLERAINLYGRGFNIRKDYYNGENYALCFNIKANLESDNDERVYCNMQAKKVRKEIINILEDILKEPNINDRDDKMWIYATLANCYIAISEKESSIKY